MNIRSLWEEHGQETTVSSYLVLVGAGKPTPGTVCPKKDVEKLKSAQQKATGW